jgi:hypothetical protein
MHHPGQVPGQERLGTINAQAEITIVTVQRLSKPWSDLRFQIEMLLSRDRQSYIAQSIASKWGSRHHNSNHKGHGTLGLAGNKQRGLYRSIVGRSFSVQGLVLYANQPINMILKPGT